MNTQSNAIPDTPHRSARLCARGYPGKPAPVLVGAARIVGVAARSISRRWPSPPWFWSAT